MYALLWEHESLVLVQCLGGTELHAVFKSLTRFEEFEGQEKLRKPRVP